ncbi:DinB family protein [Hyphobacterium sp. CCMP332]|nr:DinB family protein [Hyphobacterium sp. CCMP332]
MKLPEFYNPYVSLFKNEDCREVLNIEYKISLKFYKNINKKDSLFKYSPDKWSIRELLGHICDSEQIFAFRLLSILRNEKNPLPGFDHNAYVSNADFNSQEWEDLIKRYDFLRRNTIHLCNEIKKEDYSKFGNANGNDISIDALVFVIAGHEKHHRNVIKEKYLN